MFIMMKNITEESKAYEVNEKKSNRNKKILKGIKVAVSAVCSGVCIGLAQKTNSPELKNRLYVMSAIYACNGIAQAVKES